MMLNRAVRRRAVARIVEWVGQCTRTRAASAQKTMVTTGMHVRDGDAVRCSSGSSATLEFEDGSQLRVQPESEIEIDVPRGHGPTTQPEHHVSLPDDRPRNRRLSANAPAAALSPLILT